MKLKILTPLVVFPLFCSAQLLFEDNFETGLDNWEVENIGIAEIITTEDKLHKSVLQLTPNKTAECILVKDSDKWDKVVIKGEALFPTDRHDYLGLVYNYNKTERADFGCIYIKGKGSYIRVNPHRDGNASRALYEEYRTPLANDAEIKKNKWFSFKAEIIDAECHFYVTDMKTPKVVFQHYEYPKGKLGFKPRLAGGEVWMDNISIERIDDFSYVAPMSQTDINYNREALINNWKALGPFSKRINEVEGSTKNQTLRVDGQKFEWKNFSTDVRGCLLAGKISRFKTNQKLVYFSTQINSNKNKQIKIHFGSLNNLHVWVNSNYIGLIEKQKLAWFDFFENSEHSGQSLPITLDKGANRILVLVEGGNYSGDGFYSHVNN
ncbi:hypothetical protein ACFSQJ_13505 [Croceitalea marina]|uniref:3-keto-disaccharide hydrolase domain-containing protein n=1 Tax=Croceitalea marina TaxID=1775166 RepID=A0ABW5MZK5_9FLAO